MKVFRVVPCFMVCTFTSFSFSGFLFFLFLILSASSNCFFCLFFLFFSKAFFLSFLTFKLHEYIPNTLTGVLFKQCVTELIVYASVLISTIFSGARKLLNALAKTIVIVGCPWLWCCHGGEHLAWPIQELLTNLWPIGRQDTIWYVRQFFKCD